MQINITEANKNERKQATSLQSFDDLIKIYPSNLAKNGLLIISILFVCSAFLLAAISRERVSTVKGIIFATNATTVVRVPVDARVKKICVTEGQTVSRNDVIYILEISNAFNLRFDSVEREIMVKAPSAGIIEGAKFILVNQIITKNENLCYIIPLKNDYLIKAWVKSDELINYKLNAPLIVSLDINKSGNTLLMEGKVTFVARKLINNRHRMIITFKYPVPSGAARSLPSLDDLPVELTLRTKTNSWTSKMGGVRSELMKI